MKLPSFLRKNTEQAPIPDVTAQDAIVHDIESTRPSNLFLPAVGMNQVDLVTRLTALKSSGSALPQSTNLITPGPVVIIGANGSGKTRLGVWLEFIGPQQDIIHRVAAQKILSFPESASPISMTAAKLGLYYGASPDRVDHFNHLGELAPGYALEFKQAERWKRDPAVAPLTDFSYLLTYLFSNDYQQSSQFRREFKDSLGTSDAVAPTTLLDQIQAIWESVLPHRKLIIGQGNVSVMPAMRPTQVTGYSQEYSAKQMSDGERAVFYLIGQCLAAPDKSIIVIDEPETHLHKAIQSTLWDEIERARPDCLFIYLTHNLDFASTRTDAKKIWLEAYDGKAWQWKEVPETEDFPEELLLSLLGSRKPILFTEGVTGGTEHALFSKIYPDWTIKPQGSCEQVIQATKAFNSLRYLHGLDSKGIIDLDYRSPREVTALQQDGIYTLAIQEIESLLLVEPVLQLAAEHAHTHSMVADTPREITQKVKDLMFGLLNRDRELLTSRKTAWELEKELHKVDRTVIGVAALEQVRDNAAQFDVATTYAEFEQEIDQTITTRDYAALLRLYNNKGLAKQVGKYFGTLSYPDFIKRLITNGNHDGIIQALRSASPALSIANAVV